MVVVKFIIYQHGRRKSKENPKKNISNKSLLVIISTGVFKCSATIQPRPIPLDIDNELPSIYIIFVSSDKNGETFFTHVDYCAGINVVNLTLHHKHQSIYCRYLYSIL